MWLVYYEQIHLMMPEGVATKKDLFDDFKAAHGKHYSSEADAAQRLVNFHQNLRFINAKNRQVR